jgi:hypothetical protein
VLPWLSPAANLYLFSPTLGMSSATNTPGGGIFSILKSPRTPNAAAASKLSLPLTTDDIMADPKKKASAGDSGRSGAGGPMTNGPSTTAATMNGMICVSPLASRKKSNNATSNASNANVTHGQLGGGGGGSHQSQHSTINKSNNMNSTQTNTAVGELSQPDTPINFREVFASPTTDSRTGMIRTDQSNEIPELGSSIMLEKHIAERDVREDEDLNVLLKLAETTPNRKVVETKSSARSFRNQFAYSNHPRTGLYSQTHGGTEPPPSLHLPYIGKNSIKTQTTQNPQTDDFTPPPLPIRSNSSSSPNKAANNKTGDNKKGNASYQRQKSSPSHSKPTMYLHPGATHLHHPHVYQHPPPHFIHSHPPFYSYPAPHPGNVGSGHPPPPSYSIYSNKPPSVASSKSPDIRRGTKANKDSSPKASVLKRPSPSPNSADKKRSKKPTSRRGGKRQRTTLTQPLSGAEREKSAATITAINASTGSKNDKAASLAAAILRGVTMRPSGKWQAQLYYAGKSRYIGVFDTREKAALAYEIAREKLKTDRPASEQGGLSLKETEANVNAARKAAFEGVNEKDPRNEK